MHTFSKHRIVLFTVGRWMRTAQCSRLNLRAAVEQKVVHLRPVLSRTMTTVFPPRGSSLAASAKNPPNPHGPYAAAPSAKQPTTSATTNATAVGAAPAASSYGFSSMFGRANAASAANPNAAYAGWESVGEREEDGNSSQWLSQQTRKTQNDSLNTTREALSMLMASEELAVDSSNLINRQGEQLNRIENKLDIVDSNRRIADAKARELNALNRNFLIPTFNASKKSAATEAQLQQQIAAQKDGLNSAPSGSNQGYYGGMGSGASSAGGNIYTTPEGLERDEVEEEIDDNLNAMMAGLSRMKQMGENMGASVDAQNEQLLRINDKVDTQKDGLDHITKNISKHDGSKKGAGRK